MRTVAFAVSAAAALACSGGCSSTGGAGGSQAAEDKPAVTNVGTPTGPAVTAIIGPNGGQIASGDGRLTLTVPPSAVSTDTQFGVQPITDESPGGIGSAYLLMPEGTQFEVPVTVAFTYGDDDVAGALVDELAVVTQDPTALTWSTLDGSSVDATRHQVVVSTSHFSSYALHTAFLLTADKLDVTIGSTAVVTASTCPTVFDPTTSRSGYLATCRAIRSSDPVKLGAWSVEDRPSGDSSVGTITPSDAAHATFKAPAAVPKPNPVKVSVKTTAGQSVEPIKMYVVGNVYHVKADYYKAPDSVCPIASGASVRDIFEVDVDLDAQQLSNVKTNPVTATGPFTCQVVPGASVTVSIPPDIFTPVSVKQIGGFGSHHTVELKGTQKLGSCTCIAEGVPIPGDGSKAIDSLFGFEFDDTDFGDHETQTVKPIGLTSPAWTITVTKP